MKRLLTCILTACLSFFCLASCDLLQADEHTEHTYEWLTTEETHQKIYTCGCSTPDIAESHIDGNSDGLCDVCGYVMPEHEHTWELTRDEFCHCIFYTCGCLTPPNATPHLDGDGDGLCDVCGYTTPEHEHTGEWVAYNQDYHYYQYTCGCELPDKKEKHEHNGVDTFCHICGYSFTDGPTEIFFLKDYASWLTELNAENIVEIKTTFKYVGVAPGRLKDISKTTDKTVIEEVLKKYLNVEMRGVSRSETDVDGGSAFTIEFTRADGTVHQLYFNNGFYVYGLNEEEISALCYFQLYTIPSLEEYDGVEKSNGFITYIGKGTVYDGENNFVCELPIDELEFVELAAGTGVGAVVEYTVETEFGTLIFASNKIFYFEEKDSGCYQLVGKNLDEWIAV